ncbi:hypothetical protein [Myxococcus sp. AB056]|uniref:hypothetical protein n=1 Tax=Myxococcus sp. AB056 TaxID=2562792 RepID=UPI0011478429|nr:hypothetical protein [Myxococcus sp. AB056]
MKRIWNVYLALIMAAYTGGCSESVPRAEHEALKAKLQRVERELDELKNGPDRLLRQANSFLIDGKYAEARDAARNLVDRHAASAQAAEAKALLAVADQKYAEAEEKKQRDAQEAEDQRARDARDAAEKQQREANAARRREEKQIADAVRALRKSDDDVRGITFFEHKDSARHLFSRSEIHAYFAVAKDSAPSLRMRIQYKSDDWLFIERYIIKADDRTFRIDPNFGAIERDHGSGTIWEWYDVPVRDSEREILNTLAHAKKVTLRHEGKQYYKDRIISPAERKRIAEVLTAYEAILASKTTPR